MDNREKLLGIIYKNGNDIIFSREAVEDLPLVGFLTDTLKLQSVAGARYKAIMAGQYQGDIYDASDDKFPLGCEFVNCDRVDNLLAVTRAMISYCPGDTFGDKMDAMSMHVALSGGVQLILDNKNAVQTFINKINLQRSGSNAIRLQRSSSR